MKLVIILTFLSVPSKIIGLPRTRKIRLLTPKTSYLKIESSSNTKEELSTDTNQTSSPKISLEFENILSEGCNHDTIKKEISSGILDTIATEISKTLANQLSHGYLFSEPILWGCRSLISEITYGIGYPLIQYIFTKKELSEIVSNTQTSSTIFNYINDSYILNNITKNNFSLNDTNILFDYSSNNTINIKNSNNTLSNIFENTSIGVFFRIFILPIILHSLVHTISSSVMHILYEDIPIWISSFTPSSLENY